MNHIEDTPGCERRDEMISVLYGEATENEMTQFQQHMQSCATCETEMRGFGYVRESIGAWRLEAFSAMDQSTVTIPTHAPKTKSARTALREFFDLSPLWLKGAVAFATVLFCLLAVLALTRFNQQRPVNLVTSKSDAKYTEQEKNEIVRRALEEQKQTLLDQAARDSNETVTVKQAGRTQEKYLTSHSSGERSSTTDEMGTRAARRRPSTSRAR